MLKALEKRPVSSEALDAAVVHICHKLRALGEREVPSRLVGELAMEELHHLDEVAYVRFASVYRSFQDVDAFREEIERMRTAAAARRPKASWRCGPAPKAARSDDACRRSTDSSTNEMMRRALELARARALHDASQSARRLRDRARRAHRRRGLASQVGRGARGSARARSGWRRPRAARLRTSRSSRIAISSRTPPCTDALIRAGVQRVVCGTLDPNPKVSGAGVEQLVASGIAGRDGLARSRSARAQSRFREAHDAAVCRASP